MNRLILLSLCILMFCVRSHATVRYVRAAATGLNTGSSWLNAYTSLQNGLGAATSGDSVWVANGTYKPGTSRGTTFNLPSGIKVFGGFAGTETLLSQRTFTSFLTILSGDIGTTGIHTDDVYSVVSANSVSNGTRLDGFKIIYGYANTTGNPSGGGFYNSGGSPTIANCYFTDNYATNGGAFRHANGGTVNVLNCIFKNNTAGSDGGAIYTGSVSTNGTVNFIGCDISENQATSGGGCFFYAGVVNLDRCIISGNTASVFGGAMNGEDPSLTVYNSLIVGNTASDFAAHYQDFGNPNPVSFINCTVANNKNTSFTGSDFLFDLLTTNSIRNSILWANQASSYTNFKGIISNSVVQHGYASGTNIDTLAPQFLSPGNTLAAPFNAASYDYHLSALSHAIDTGNNTYLSSIYMQDLGGAARLTGSKVDLGAYEQAYCSFTPAISPAASINQCGTTPVALTASGGASYLWYNGAATASLNVISAGTYKVTAVDASGCRGVATKIVNPQATSVQIAGSDKLCPGSANVLTAAGSNIAVYYWNTTANTSTVTVTATGTYTVTVSGNDGCIQSSSITITAGTTPAPVVSNNGGTLNAGSFTSYQWLLNGAAIAGETSATYTPTANGSYSVTVTNTDGCSGTSAAYVLTNLGLVQINPGSGISVFPNPAQSVIRIDLKDIRGQVGLSLYNLLGQLVWSQTETGQASIQAPVDQLPAGCYSLRIATERGTFYRQVFVAH